jgi:hypothetical protein
MTLGLGVEHHLANLLRTPARFGESRSPSNRLMTTGQLENDEPTEHRFALGEVTQPLTSVRLDDGRLLAQQPATRDVEALIVLEFMSVPWVRR